MPVIRINKTKDFTIMSNDHLKNKNITLKAKGLQSQMLSFPDGWEYSVAGLAALSKDGKDAVRSAIEELERAGYIVRSQAHDDAGKFCGYDYTIYETPQAAAAASDKPMMENSTTAFPPSDAPSTEKPTQLITNETNTNESKTKKGKDVSDTRHHHGEYKNVLMTDSELAKLKAEFPADWSTRIERLSEYMACTGRSYKSYLAVIRSWARKDAKAASKSPSSKQVDYSFNQSEVL